MRQASTGGANRLLRLYLDAAEVGHQTLAVKFSANVVSLRVRQRKATRPGLEPGTRVPKTLVLPLHHRVGGDVCRLNSICAFSTRFKRNRIPEYGQGSTGCRGCFPRPAKKNFSHCCPTAGNQPDARIASSPPVRLAVRYVFCRTLTNYLSFRGRSRGRNAAKKGSELFSGVVAILARPPRARMVKSSFNRAARRSTQPASP